MRSTAVLRRPLSLSVLRDVTTHVDRIAFGALLTLCLVFGLGDVNTYTPAGAAIMAVLRPLLLAVIGLAAMSMLLTARDTRLSRALLLAAAAWLGVQLLSAWLAPTHQPDAIAYLQWPAQCALLGVCVACLARTEARWRMTCAALGVGGAGVALVGLAQAANLGPMQEWLRDLQDGSVPLGDIARITSTLSHPNVAAIVFELTLPLLVATALVGSSRRTSVDARDASGADCDPRRDASRADCDARDAACDGSRDASSLESRAAAGVGGPQRAAAAAGVGGTQRATAAVGVGEPRGAAAAAGVGGSHRAAAAAGVGGAKRVVFGALAVAVLLALVLTYSRAGLLAAGVGLAVMAGVGVLRGARRAAAGIALAAAAIPLAILAAVLLTRFELGYRLVAELDQTGFRATYAAPTALTASPGEALAVPVRLTNAGSATLNAAGNRRVAVGYHVLEPTGRPIHFDGAATPLPGDLTPSASADLVAHVQAPSEAGTYLIEWDAVREGIAWFSWGGSSTAITRLIVEAGSSSTATTRLVVEAGSPASQAAPTADAQTRGVLLPKPGRVQLWAAAWAMFTDYPVLGVGPDNFHVRFGDFSGVPESKLGTHAHSMYLEALADTGVVGFAALACLVGVAVWLGLRGLVLDANAGSVWVYRAALLASLTAWLVHGLLDDLQRFWPVGLALWVILGLIARGAELASRPAVLRAG